MRKVWICLFLALFLSVSVVLAACDFTNLYNPDSIHESLNVDAAGSCTEEELVISEMFLIDQFKAGGYIKLIENTQNFKLPDGENVDFEPFLRSRMLPGDMANAIPRYVRNKYGADVFDQIERKTLKDIYNKGISAGRDPVKHLEKQYGSKALAATILGPELELKYDSKAVSDVVSEISDTTIQERFTLKKAVKNAQAGQKISSLDSEEYQEILENIKEYDLNLKTDDEALIALVEATDAKTRMENSLSSDLAIRTAFEKNKRDYEQKANAFAEKIGSEEAKLDAQKTVLELEKEIAQKKLDDAWIFTGEEEKALALADAKLAEVKAKIAALETPVEEAIAGPLPPGIQKDPLTGEVIVPALDDSARSKKDKQFNLQKNTKKELAEQAKIADEVAKELGISEKDRMRLVEGIKNGDPNAVKAYQALLGKEMTGQLDDSTKSFALQRTVEKAKLVASCGQK